MESEQSGNHPIAAVSSSFIEKIRRNPDSKYFLVKSYREEHIEVAKARHVWATSGRNEAAFAHAFDTNPYVILIFSVNGSGKFFGHALMKSRPGESKQRAPLFTAADGRPFPGRMFDIAWLSTKELPFKHFDGITNGFNENKPVKVGRDGQALTWVCGGQVLQIFETANPQPAPPHVSAHTFESSLFGNRQGVPLQPSTDHHLQHQPSQHQQQQQQQQQQQLMLSHHQLFGAAKPPPPPPMTVIGVEGYEDLIEVNPSLAIYPIDLTEMDYKSYKNLHALSLAEVHADSLYENVAAPLIKGWSDWTSQACAQANLSVDEFAEKLMTLVENEQQ